MPLTHARTFRVRHSECDAYGHVNNAVYLRWMQETAFDASAAAGYSLDRYAAMNRTWWAHETQIEYLQPLTYGDSVTVKTWVADFRRVRSRRMYELHKDGTETPVAHGYTDWAFLDMTTGRPAPIPAELITAFFPNGAPSQAPARDPFPNPPPPPPGVFVARRRVEFRDIDPVGHLNNANYIAYAGEVGFELSAAFGWPPERMLAEGMGIIARQHHIEYRQQAVFGDELEIATWFSAPKRISATRHYTIKRVRDGALLARVHSLYVWVDLKTLQPMRIPAHFLADFAANMAE